MAMNPEVQRRAQEQLDLVLGSRLPTFEDRKDLPYIDTICKEVFRVYPVGPLGIPHSTTRDDVYGDIWIPNGTVVIPNIW